MIHVFHGFLGSPDDFSFLRKEDVVLHDLYQSSQAPSTGPEDILIGYSMGGRIALELAHKAQYKFRKLILINAHPGLATQEERNEREIFENKVQEKMEELSLGDFLFWWNKLPIFSSDEPISTTIDRFDKSPELFEANRLSNQPYYLPEMKLHHEKILYLVGNEDQKYMTLATETLIPAGIRVKVISGGHRLFQKKHELLKVFTEEGVL